MSAGHRTAHSDRGEWRSRRLWRRGTFGACQGDDETGGQGESRAARSQVQSGICEGYGKGELILVVNLY